LLGWGFFCDAIAGLHNFIRKWDPDDLAEDDGDFQVDELEHDFQNHNLPPQIPLIPENLGGQITATERAQASAKRDEIAMVMWADYIEELRIRGGGT
jgi:hypothetical protein